MIIFNCFQDHLLTMGSESNESKAQYHSARYYIVSFLLTYMVSVGVPASLFFIFISYLFIPNILTMSSIFDLFLNLNSLIVLLLTPVVIIGNYLLHLYLVALTTKKLYNRMEKDEPYKDGIIPRNKSSKTLTLHHRRSFILKYPKWAILKSPFPWLAVKYFNYLGVNKMGKGTTFEEQVTGDKYVQSGKNCYFGVNTILTSHLVEGSHGDIKVFTIKVGDNVTFPSFGCLAPGVHLGNNTCVMPISAAAKHDAAKDNCFLLGIPLRKIFPKKVQEWTGLTKEQQGIKKKKGGVEKTE